MYVVMGIDRCVNAAKWCIDEYKSPIICGSLENCQEVIERIKDYSVRSSSIDWDKIEEEFNEKFPFVEIPYKIRLNCNSKNLSQEEKENLKIIDKQNGIENREIFKKNTRLKKEHEDKLKEYQSEKLKELGLKDFSKYESYDDFEIVPVESAGDLLC